MTETVTPATPSFPYELRTFPAELDGAIVPERLAKWAQAVALGFYGDPVTAESLRHFAESEQRDGRVEMGAYLADANTPAGAWDASYPVATYAYHRKDLNVGAGAMLPLHQVTAVTVRPSHRRRGILRAMITSDLARAKADGLAMAALTASESTIYGRFGFGPATHESVVTVATKGGLRFHNQAAASAGVVEVADAAVLAELHDGVFARVHAGTFGSVGRQDMYRRIVCGQGSYESMKPDTGVRAALHFDDAGEVDGFVSYKPNEPSVTIVDLLAANGAAYLALWNYLGSLDLIESVKWKKAPEVDPLEWAMATKRDYQRTETEDQLWLRILDVPAALAARHYWADGAVTLAVNDPLGHTDGTYRVEAAGGVGSVAAVPADSAADLILGVSELSSLYLGRVTATTLLAAGRLREGRAGGAAAFDALFGTDVAAHCMTAF
jgi:predicted acetyltransferase